MSITNDLSKIIVVGDRILIKPNNPNDRTKGGLLLPPGVLEKEKTQTGYVVKVGPGYPIPAIADADESWKNNTDEVKYVPIQPKVGDLALYVQNSGWEITFNDRKIHNCTQFSHFNIDSR